MQGHINGNLFYLGGILRLLSERGRLDLDAPSGVDSDFLLPAGVRDVIGGRLGRLSVPCYQMLATAAVIGRGFDFQLLQLVDPTTTEEDLIRLVEEALGAWLFEDVPGVGDRHRFTHALVRQTLSESLSGTRKIRLHARIGEALESVHRDRLNEHAAQLAHHFGQAASVLGNSKVVRYALVAGEQASVAYAYEEGVEHFRLEIKAKDIDPDAPAEVPEEEAAALLFGLVRAKAALFSFRPGYLKEAVRVLRMVFEIYVRTGDVDRALTVSQYPLRPLVGEWSGLANIVGPALEIAPPDSLALGRLLALYGRVKGLEEGDYPAAEAAFQKGIAIAKKIGGLDLEQRTLAEAAQVDFYHLHHEKAINKARDALAVPSASQDLFLEWASWYTLCDASLVSGKPINTRDTLTFLAVAERLGNRFWMHMAYWIQEWVYRTQGDWSKAREFSDRGLEIAPGAPTIISTRAVLEFETGETE